MSIQKISRNDKIFMVAYDQGLEHGPSADFDERNCDTQYVLEQSIQAGASCIAMQYGMAKHFYQAAYREQIPLILKLNGKTKLNSENFKSAVIADVEDALRLGAVGIGFTIFPGQTDEHSGYEQLAILRQQAEKNGLLVAVWSYARGPEIDNQFDPDVVAYAVRAAAELGADLIKVKYPGSPEAFRWAVKNAGGAKVLASGTDNFSWENYHQDVSRMLSSGASGVAIGRRFWQDDNPSEFGKQLANVIYQ